MIVKEINGDLFSAIKKISYDTTVVIGHCCNNKKIWGSGFVIPLEKNFPKSKEVYLNSYCYLGATSYCTIGNFAKPSTIIFNMVGQDGIYCKDNLKPIKYAALCEAMVKVKADLNILWAEGCRPENIEFHIPRFGSDRAKGDWSIIKELINEIWVDYPVYVYYL